MNNIRPVNLRCEHLAAPRGLNTRTPRFSWALAGDGRDRLQTAYRIVVSEHPEDFSHKIWDSGKVLSGETSFIRYAGAPLKSDKFLYWKVCVWDEADQISHPVSPATFATGLMDAADWQADWIGRYFVLPTGRETPSDNAYGNIWQARPADYMRRDFVATKTVRRATVYVTALGLYELYLNGQRVGDEVMAPGWTDYHQRVEYQTHDVTGLMVSGKNTLGAILGEGWYSGRIGHNQRRAGNHYGGRPALLCQLHIEYDDGTVEKVTSDADWKTRQGPICYSDFLVGEHYDARLETPGWNQPQFDDPHWQPVETFIPEPKAPKINASLCQPAREVSEHPARYLHTTNSGTLIYDLGQNLAGYVRLEVTAPAGAKFTLRHAEILDDDGTVYTKNLRYAVCVDHYVAKGQGREVFKPRFTFHGFRYVELTLPEGIDPGTISLTGIAIQTDTPVTGTLETGNAMVNQLISNIGWSQRGNFLSVPTDCPQRDERLGWSADAQVFWRTAGYNMDVSAFLAKWFEDIVDAQLPDGAFTDIAPSRPLNSYRQTAQPGAPGWGDAPVILAWQQYLRYGDRGMIRDHYRALKRWMAHIGENNPDFIRTHSVYNNYGDWLSVGPVSDRTVVATAYWVHVADIMAKIANALDETKNANTYEILAANIRSAFENAFVDADGKITGDTQTAYLLALDFNILPPDLHDKAAGHLRARLDDADGHLQTGFLGVKHLCPVLSDIGASEYAYRLLLNTTYPSWGFSIAHGATTIWERWDGWTPESGFQSAAMNSFNHYAYGSVGEWLYARMAGIDWDEDDPGFRTIRFRPLFNKDIGWVKAKYQATTGEISSDWQMSGDDVTWTISIPPNCKGKITLPAPANKCTLDGQPLQSTTPENMTQTNCILGSGTYSFSITGYQDTTT
ncbi:MAG: family 78 glycoside hydrolase catalytic domain [Paracoccaceae bacterium]